MHNIQSEIEKSIKKKEKLKSFSLDTIALLESANIEKRLKPDYISPNGNTIFDYKRIISRLKTCSSSIIYDIKKPDSISESKQNYKILEINSCNNYTLCPVCASMKRNRVLQQIEPYTRVLKKAGANFYMITATIENYKSNEIGKGYQILRDGWTNFIKRGQRRKNGRSQGEAAKILGYLMSVEIKPAKYKKGYYHIHSHILVVTDEKLDYSILSTKKRDELIKYYGYGNIPDYEYQDNAQKYIIDKKTENPVMSNLWEKIPASKISQEWYNSTGYINFRIDHIKNKKIFSKKRKKWEYKTIEQQIPEVVKYECKSWEFTDGLDLLKTWDSISGKRRITRGGYFLPKNQKHFFEYLDKYNLRNYFLEYYIEDIGDLENDDNLEGITAVIFDHETKEYFEPDNLTCIKNYYKSADGVKKVRQLRCYALNNYRVALSDLKKFIGVIPNKNWIIEKEDLRQSLLYVNNLINNEFIRDLYGLNKISFPIKPVQLNLFSDVMKKIRDEKSKIFHCDNVNLIIRE